MINSEMNGNLESKATLASGDDTQAVNGIDKVTSGRSKSFKFSSLSLEEIRLMHDKFVVDRDWEKFHMPRNILLALVGEVGEVSEHFQWRSDQECVLGLPHWTEDQRQKLGEELSDVLIYLTRLSDRCGIDLSSAVRAKMVKNEQKYPIEKAFGTAKKYNELITSETEDLEITNGVGNDETKTQQPEVGMVSVETSAPKRGGRNGGGGGRGQRGRKATPTKVIPESEQVTANKEETNSTKDDEVNSLSPTPNQRGRKRAAAVASQAATASTATNEASEKPQEASPAKNLAKRGRGGGKRGGRGRAAAK